MDELTLLKQQAAQLGITHSNNISVDTLRAKIKAHLEDAPKTDTDDGLVSTMEASPTETKAQRDRRIRNQIKKDQMKLVRLRITNMDPSKANLRGEIVTVQNRYLGTVKKFIPFGEAAEAGYHVPWVIYQALLDKKFNQVKTRKGRDSREIVVEQRMVREYALEVLPPLTKSELAALAASQAARLGLDDNAER